MNDGVSLFIGALIGAYANVVTAKWLAFQELKVTAMERYGMLAEGNCDDAYLERTDVMRVALCGVSVRFIASGHKKAAHDLDDLSEAIDERFNYLVANGKFKATEKAEYYEAFGEVFLERTKSWTDAISALRPNYRELFKPY